MEIYTLDELLRRNRVFDQFESLIWTERFQSAGDFQLVMPSNSINQNIFQPGTLLALNESFRCMRVDTIEDGVNSEGEAMLEISGQSIETMMQDRVAFNAKTGLTAHPKWVLTGSTPFTTAEKIFEDICRDGINDPDDIIPFLAGIDLFPVDTIQGPDEAITLEIEPQSVYDAVKGVCELYDFGFRLCRNFDNSQLVFDIYTGVDRTSQQVNRPAVIFSPELENLQNTKELTSTNGFKNIAWVYSPVGFAEVVALGVDPSVVGFERHVLVVRADDITSTDPPTALAQMIQRGNEELSKHRTFGAFDGEVSQYSQYKYGVDYNLGDLVETRNSAGLLNFMRVTEQIFVSDEEGDRSYPTFSVKKFITPGSWASWPNKVWEDYEVDPLAWVDA